MISTIALVWYALFWVTLFLLAKDEKSLTTCDLMMVAVLPPVVLLILPSFPIVAIFFAIDWLWGKLPKPNLCFTVWRKP